MKITIKTTRMKEIIECSKYIEGMAEGTLQINDDIRMTDIYKLITRNDYIVTETLISGDKYAEVMINCKEITTVRIIGTDENR